MAITLYTISGSPYAWRCHLALEHKGVDYELKILSAQDGELRSPEYTAINPRQKVPSLVEGDLKLYESAVILEYLEDRFPDAPPLFPGDATQRALIRRLGREVDLYAWPAHFDLVLELFFKPDPSTRDEERIAAGLEGWRKELAFFENAIAGDYLAGDELSAADFTLFPFVAAFPRFELRKPDLGLGDALGPKLRAWKGRIEALPYYDKTYPPHWKA